MRSWKQEALDPDILRAMIGFAAQRLVGLEIEAKTGAAHGECSPERLAQRNGYRDRCWETRGWHGLAAHSKSAHPPVEIYKLNGAELQAWLAMCWRNFLIIRRSG